MISKSAFICLLLLGVMEIFCDVEQNHNNRDEPETDPIAFVSEANFKPVLNMTKCADRTICTAVLNYPEDHVLRVFKGNTTRYKHLLNIDQVDADIVNRFTDLDQTLCDSTVDLQEPKAGRNKDDEWLFIVNHKNYKQAVEVRICSNANKPCNMHENFPVKTECRQKYILRKMLALDPDDGKLKEDTFKLPSCCSCRYFDNKRK